MQDKTPIQQAIEFWKYIATGAGTPQLKEAAETVVDHLESLLPKEREFVGKVWDAAQPKEGFVQAGPVKAMGNIYPDKQQFIKSLYGE